MNNITKIQNEVTSITMLKAQRKVCRHAKDIAYASFAVFVLPVVLGNIAKFWLVDNTVYMYVLVAYSGLAAILKVALSEWGKRIKKKAALIQQVFDMHIFGMSWQKHWGKKPTIEEINEIAHGEPDAKLPDWYETSIGKANHDVGILLCQMESISYDGRLKKIFYWAIHIFFALFVAIDIIYGVCSYKDSATSFFFYSFIPLSPLIVWYAYLLINRKNENDLRQKLELLTSDAWTIALTKQQIPMSDLVVIQDMLLRYRQSGNAVPDIIYFNQRNEQEGIAYESVKDRLRELGID